MTANVWAKIENNPSCAFESSHSNHYRLLTYIAVIYNTMVHATQHLECQNFGPNFALRNDTLYLILTDELWGVFHVLFQRKWLRYIESTLYSEQQMMDDRQWAASTWNHITDQSFGCDGYIHHTDMPLQNLENQEISGKKTGDLTKNQEIISNKFCRLSQFKLCIFSIIF